MPENPHIKQRNQIITELQADLTHAYQVINQQQEYINQLEEQLSQKSPKTHISSAPSDKSAYPQGKIKTRYQVKKRVLPYQKKSGKLSQLQFTAIVAVVVVFITLIGSALMRRPSSNPSKQTTDKAATSPKSTTSFPPAPNLTPIPQNKSNPVILPPKALVNSELSELVYNVQTPPNFRKSKTLQSTVDAAVNLAVSQGLPKKPLSITLIDVKTGEYAQYQQEKPRFPASVIKMFWMVYLYGQIQNGRADEIAFTPYIDAMVKKSDNNAASTVIDAVTQTEFTKDLKEENYQNWLKKRNQLNIFFQKAGYNKININQKTYPITDKKIYEPQGADLRMRGDPKDPIRNKITTQQAARILYEIYSSQAISPLYSEKMANWLSIDAETRIEKREQQDPNVFNPVRGYFSESLPTDVYFGGKAGWTSASRQEAAYIATRDGATYILVVFAEDRAYAYDWKIFPKISDLVFKRMTNTN
ncbi:serine hydrolase [Anabaena sp. UHCC 0399]|uniref:serine hydrolase n=1 Tax=Anabaena sp. UHCC 0399 TaxID=3110238 RepID=UPI002B212DD4|nr:serine hydrolase [Anabaena sp. UHCC 0399]MEA5566504.1 serine hydrolase [Anabaena sp. UHCC 0399]